MRKSISKITLAATLGLALAFTVSCSDDDDNKDTWNTCDELGQFGVNCVQIDPTNVFECVKTKIDCNGTAQNECMEHYKNACPEYAPFFPTN